MKNLRNRNQPVNADLVQVYLESAWDKVEAVYSALSWLQEIGDALIAGELQDFVAEVEINTLAKLNALVADATLVDVAAVATAAQGALADNSVQLPFANQAEAEAGINNSRAMTPLRVAQAIAFLGQNTKNNLTAVVDPTITDDSSSGYAVGSNWINTVTKEAYRCVDATIGAAVWVNSTLSSSELAPVALSGDSDDLIEGAVQLLMTVAERNKLAGLEAGATGDLTGAEIKTLYEAELDTNAFTDALLTKLNGIEIAAQVNRALASQVEAEAGTENSKGMTPLRVSQAISALASTLTESMVFAIADEDSDISLVTAALTTRMPYAFRVTGVRAHVKGAPTGAAIQVDINANGASILTNPLTIDDGEKTSTTSAVDPLNGGEVSVADDAEITFDVDQVGSTTPGNGLKIALIGHKE